MTTILVSLIGHQPLPTLLAIRHIKPDKVILLGSNAPVVHKRRMYLADMLKEERSLTNSPIELIETDPIDEWSFLGIESELTHALRRYRDATIICDVTGGTKAMAIGLMQFARQRKSEVIYIVSEQLNTKLWKYSFNADGNFEEQAQVSVPSLLKMKDLFHAYLGNPEIRRKEQPTNSGERGSHFERDVILGFQSYVDCMITSVYADRSKQEEIDIILRKRNRFALVECKSGLKESMDGIKQLNNAASDRYLGTYTAKILATTIPYNQLTELADLHDIHIIELVEWQENKDQPYTWNVQELSKFEKVVKQAFE